MAVRFLSALGLLGIGRRCRCKVHSKNGYTSQHLGLVSPGHCPENPTHLLLACSDSVEIRALANGIGEASDPTRGVERLTSWRGEGLGVCWTRRRGRFVISERPVFGELPTLGDIIASKRRRPASTGLRRPLSKMRSRTLSRSLPLPPPVFLLTFARMIVCWRFLSGWYHKRCFGV